MKFLIVITLSVLAGCATAPSEIPAADVSPLQYKDYDCDDIANELSRIVKKMQNAYMQLDKKAKDDTTQAALGVIFWPTLFFLEGGDGPQAIEYSTLKGKFNALEEVSIKKKCGIDFPNQPKPSEK